MIFFGKVSDGGILQLKDKLRWDKILIYKLAGEEVQIEIDKKKHPRSLAQNNYLWGIVYSSVAEHTGYHVNELHEIFKGMFLPPRIVQYKDKEIKLMGSTTKLTKSGFVEYIERIKAEFPECHIETPEEAGFMTK